MSNHHPDATRRPRRKPGDAPEALPLFDFGANAQATRAEAHAAALPRQADRLTHAAEILFERGSIGCTRHELADLMGLPIQSICSIALKLLQNETATETDIRRRTPSGASAAVIVHGGIEHV